MSIADNALPLQDTGLLHALFSQLDAQQVETFYKKYQQWQLEQQSTALQEQLVTLEQRIADNQVLMQLAQPSPIALAALTRLQSLGVDDVDLLDSMLERGDTWLDHTLQLLEQCERLDVIHGNYTEWCQHALEDAYNWLDSIHEQEQPAAIAQTPPNEQATETLLLQKLMSEEETETISTTTPDPVGSNDGVSQTPLDTVGTAFIPSVASLSPQQPDVMNAVPTGETQYIPIPSVLSYATTIEKALTSIQPQEERKKSPKYGLVSRVLARVWKT